MTKTRPTVLVAEDHAGILEKVSKLLCKDFNVVGAVMDGAAALVDATRLNPDVVVMDITMPHLDGIQAASQIRKNGTASRIVFFSVNEDPDLIAEVLETGASGYVIKSRLNSDLVFAIEEALAGRVFVSTIALRPRAASSLNGDQ
jgi:DNA-binding NarL/FixJ family response regulator